MSHSTFFKVPSKTVFLRRGSRVTFILKEHISNGCVCGELRPEMSGHSSIIRGSSCSLCGWDPAQQSRSSRVYWAPLRNPVVNSSCRLRCQRTAASCPLEAEVSEMQFTERSYLQNRPLPKKKGVLKLGEGVTASPGNASLKSLVNQPRAYPFHVSEEILNLRKSLSVNVQNMLCRTANGQLLINKLIISLS